MVCIRLRQENCKPDKIPLLRADICALLQVDLQASHHGCSDFCFSGHQCSLCCASATFSSSYFFAFSCMRVLDLSRSTFFQFFSENMKIISGFSPAFTIAHYNVADLESCLSDFGLHNLSTSGWRDQSFRFWCLKWPLLLGPLGQL